MSAPAAKTTRSRNVPGLLSSRGCASFKDVEHSCEKCGSLVEDGRPFCPHCRAPQVRVEVATQSPPSNFDIQAEAEAETAPASLDRLPAHDPSGRPFFRTALHAGLLGVVANVLLFGLGIVFTGVIAAWLHRRAGGERLPSGPAARLGAMAGAISFAVSALLKAIIIVLLHAQQQYRDLMMKAVDQSAVNPADPQVQAFLQWVRSPEGFAIFLALTLAIALIFSMVFSAVACLATNALSRDRNLPAS